MNFEPGPKLYFQLMDHNTDTIKRCLNAFCFFNSDGSVFSDFIHRVSNNFSNIEITIG